MVLKEDQRRLQHLLSETIPLLCKNGLQYKSEFCIEVFVGITLDQDEMIHFSLKESFANYEAQKNAQLEASPVREEPETTSQPIKTEDRDSCSEEEDFSDGDKEDSAPAQSKSWDVEKSYEYPVAQTDTETKEETANRLQGSELSFDCESEASAWLDKSAAGGNILSSSSRDYEHNVANRTMPSGELGAETSQSTLQESCTDSQSGDVIVIKEEPQDMDYCDQTDISQSSSQQVSFSGSFAEAPPGMAYPGQGGSADSMSMLPGLPDSMAMMPGGMPRLSDMSEDRNYGSMLPKKSTTTTASHDRDEMTSSAGTGTPRKVMVMCTVCGAKLCDVYNLQRHIRSKHQAVCDLFQCSQCTRNYRRKDHLLRHMRSSHGKSPTRRSKYTLNVDDSQQTFPVYQDGLECTAPLQEF